MAEFSNKAAFCITHRINGFGSLSEKSPERASYQSPGLAALFAAYPGDGVHFKTTLKGLNPDATLSGLITQLHPPPG
jgi:hypothetical protein